MKEYEFPKDIERALGKLDNLILESKPVPLKDQHIVVDKHKLREIHTIIFRDLNRIAELRKTCIADAQEEAKKIVDDAQLEAFKLKEALITESVDSNDAHIQAANAIKDNAMQHLQYNLNNILNIISDFDQFKEGLEQNLNEMQSYGCK